MIFTKETMEQASKKSSRYSLSRVKYKLALSLLLILSASGKMLAGETAINPERYTLVVMFQEPSYFEDGYTVGKMNACIEFQFEYLKGHGAKVCATKKLPTDYVREEGVHEEEICRPNTVVATFDVSQEEMEKLNAKISTVFTSRHHKIYAEVHDLDFKQYSDAFTQFLRLELFTKDEKYGYLVDYRNADSSPQELEEIGFTFSREFVEFVDCIYDICSTGLQGKYPNPILRNAKDWDAMKVANKTMNK